MPAALAGKIPRIAFEAGKDVRQDELLVRQDISSEQAQLAGAEAQVALTRLNLERNQELLEKNYISQAEFDAAEAAYRQARSAVERIKAEIAKKTIRAPFAGRLGIRQVDLGQMLDSGQEMSPCRSSTRCSSSFSFPSSNWIRSVRVCRSGCPVTP